MRAAAAIRRAGWLLALGLLPLCCRSFTVSGSERSEPGADAGHAGDEASVAAGQAGQGQAGSDLAGAPTAGGRPSGLGGEGGVSGEGQGGAPILLLPSDFARLGLWLEADETHCLRDATDHVVQWGDQAEDAQNPANAVNERMPLFVAGVQAGHAVVHFEAHTVAPNAAEEPSLLVLADQGSLQLGSEDFAYVAVARWSNPLVRRLDGANPLYEGVGTLLRKQEKFGLKGVSLMANYVNDSSQGLALSRFAVDLGLDNGLALSSSIHLNNDVFRVVVARRVDAELSVRINGVKEGATQIEDDLELGAIGEDLYLGGVSARPFVGDIAEIVLIRGKLSDFSLTALERQLLRKYELD